MTSMAARVATGGALALIGLVALKFVFGILSVGIALTLFLLFKVLPIFLIVLLVIWLIRKATRSSSSTA